MMENDMTQPEPKPPTALSMLERAATCLDEAHKAAGGADDGSRSRTLVTVAEGYVEVSDRLATLARGHK